jgi:F-type H+-transporting ATPase subunit a
LNSLWKYSKIFFYLIKNFYFSEVGQHFYWTIFNFQVHGQVLMNTWFVILIILTVAIFTTRDLKLVPGNGQSFIEVLTEFVRDIARTQIGEKNFNVWVPYVGTMFLFIFVCNWSGALVPWKILELPNGELGAPTNDMLALKLIFFSRIIYFNYIFLLRF